MIKLNIGSGNFKPYSGFTNVDLLPGEHIQVVAPADKLPYEDNAVDEILAEHIIEHLTFFQFNRAIAEWFRVLKLNGTLTIECPDLLGLCKQFVEANEFGRYQSYKGYWPIICHLYGHQRGRTEEEQLSQVHKTGYTLEHLKLVLSSCGFANFKELTPVKGVPGTPVIRLQCVKLHQDMHHYTY